MGRTLALALFAAGLVLVSGCDDSCKRGTLSLHVLLVDTAPLADTITIADDGSSPPLMESVSRTPDPPNLFYDELWVEVAWPGGYPANDVVHLKVRAIAGDALLGDADADVRIDPGCTSAHVNLFGHDTPDAGVADSG
ncbi:MAG: hypothetical protein ACXVDD_19395, partial [Polyangia bacterium]